LLVDQRRRNYLVHIPLAYDSNSACPVVLAFHGGGSNAEQMVHFCGLNEKANRAGFIVVYPNGTGGSNQALTWNGGNCCGYAQERNVDDVAFVRALLEDLGKVVKLDPKRVYATGMSNGAILVYRLASELADRIAAIAPVAGPMGQEHCHPSRPVSVIHFHGTEDEFAPFKGGRGPKSLTKTIFRSVEQSIQAWVEANQCPQGTVEVKLPVQFNDGTTVKRKTFGPGKGGAEVVLVTIEGGGHTWPGQEPRFKILGKSTKNVSANDLMWDFFQKHPSSQER
jgi:polyhydroxybutyrate depolymerase